jgi:hypothetical protein
VHLKSEKGLVVKQSTVGGAGKGLFTTKRVRRKARVAKYSARRVQRRPTPGSEYNMRVSANKYLDGSSKQTHSGRYVNDARGSNKTSNVRFGRQRKLYRADNRRYTPIIAKRNIPAGAELLLSYGSDYWR